MLDIIDLALRAVALHEKVALKTVRGRAGRTHHGPAIARELRAAGGKQNHGTAFSYPSGKSIR